MSARDIVKFKLDSKKPLTVAQRKRLAVVAKMPDAEINYSDISRSRSRGLPHIPDVSARGLKR